ncbi:MAG: hypothetical protein JWO32_1301 [Bacteroidetes bacterium]|nr:hypothetical protein [Bacteroidota bacterium]
MTNEEFFNANAKSGAVCLVGGTHFIDRTIQKAQKKITVNKAQSAFSHAFIFSEQRIDTKWWVIESDLEIHAKQVKLGVQENRVDKYFDEKQYPNIAILDFNLSLHDTRTVISEGLNLVAGRGKYSLREILGVLFSFTRTDRAADNIFSQNNSYICSALVQHCYQKANINFNAGVSLKHITPEDIFATKHAHQVIKLIREN